MFNSKHFGVPQHRERVFIIGHLRGAGTEPIFPFGEKDAETNGNYIKQINDSKKIREKLKYESIWRVFSPDGISPTLDTMQGGNREPKIRVKEATVKGYSEAEVGDSINFSHPNSKTRRGRVGKKLANTLLTGETQAVVAPGFKIRKLTPKECWRLQGFPDWAFDKASKVNSNSQLYKQAGNSVTVPVIASIANKLR